MNMLTKQSDEESAKKTKEIEFLEKTIAEMKLGLGSKVVITEYFDPIDTTLNPARQR